MAERESIRVVDAALHTATFEDGIERLVVRGIIHVDSLGKLAVPDYQREVWSPAKIKGLKKAFRRGSLPPDIDLGMRGTQFTPREGSFYLHDDTYIIDGLQRVTAALQLLNEADARIPHLGAMVHIDTTEAWERERFQALNLEQSRLSPNVMLRNLAHENRAAALLIELSEDPDLTIRGKISWSQNMSRGSDLMNAMVFARVVAMLHSHIGPGKASGVLNIAAGLDKIIANAGEANFRANVLRFFEVVNTCWDFNRISYRATAIYVKANFLLPLARLFSDIPEFWEGSLFVFDRARLQKLAKFSVIDPTIEGLVKSNAEDMVYLKLLEHMNSNTRSRRLVPRALRA